MIKNILQISAYCGPNGGNYVASMLLLDKKMQEHGYKTIYALCETVKDYCWCKDLEKRAKVYYLPVRRARIKKETYLTLKRIFAENNISIVHTHFELYDIPVSIMAPKNIKVFWHLHDPIADGFYQAPLSRRCLTKFQYSILGRKATLLTCSRKHGDFAVYLGFPKSKMYYIPNGLDLSRIKNTSGFQKNSEFLMFCWDFYRKGGDLAVAAANNLYKEFPNFNLRFVPNNLKAEAPYIIQQSAVDDVNELFEKAGAFLHLSRSEGLSYALLEAIYAGLPVICSDIPENLVVQDCPTVCYVKQENVEEIVLAMKNVIEKNFKINSNDVEQSRKVIETQYSLDTWCNNVIKIYFDE